VSSEAAARPSPFDAVADRLRSTYDAVESLRPAYVLGALVAAQWLGVLALALTVKHNGWLYYAGGDQLWHYSGAYLLAHGHLPPAFVGYGWSVLLLPIALVAGPNLVSALPAIVLLNAVVLLPVALFCVYGIAARIAGRLFGYFAAALWIGLPYLGIMFVEPGYHQKYTEVTLPQLVGLTSVPDFPSMVALIVAAYFSLRSLDAAGWQFAVAAGLAAGYSIAIKPSNSLFLVAPVLLLLVRRWRALPWLAAGLAPALLTLAVWKYRGLGELAAAPAEPVRSAVGIDSLLHRIHNPSLNSWEHLHQVLLGLREHFWVARVIEWLPLAGLVALLARSRRGLLLVGSWFIVYLLFKATYIPASVEDASFFRIMMPSFPAYLLLSAAVVLLVPGVRARPAPATVTPSGRRLMAALAAGVAVFAILPLGVVAATPRLHDGGRRLVHTADTIIPVSAGLRLHASSQGGEVHLTWKPGNEPSTAKGFYRVLRWNGAGLFCAGVSNGASNDCQLYTQSVGATRGTSFVDRPAPGTWTYHVGISANWLNDPSLGDVYVISRPVTVTVP
jgi:hypothetical protein